MDDIAYLMLRRTKGKYGYEYTEGFYINRAFGCHCHNLGFDGHFVAGPQ